MRAAWILLLLALAGCRPPSFPYALRPAATGPVYFATQEVVFHLPGGDTQRVLTTVENDGKRLSIVASSPMGQTLFILASVNGEVTLDARVPLPRQFDPRILPILIQLCDWPLIEARKGLPPGAELLESGSVRTLTRKGKPFLILDRQGAAPPYRTISFKLPSMRLNADITTLDDQ